MECTKAITKTDTEFCKEAILEFRPNLDPETVVDQVFNMIAQEGFELFFLPNGDNMKARTSKTRSTWPIPSKALPFGAKNREINQDPYYRKKNNVMSVTLTANHPFLSVLFH